MTVAVDLKTGKVIGQILDSATAYKIRGGPFHPHTLTILTRDGYTTVPAASVRVEKV